MGAIEVAETIDLHRSTVSQHLKEMCRLGELTSVGRQYSADAQQLRVFQGGSQIRSVLDAYGKGKVITFQLRNIASGNAEYSYFEFLKPLRMNQDSYRYIFEGSSFEDALVEWVRNNSIPVNSLSGKIMVGWVFDCDKSKTWLKRKLGKDYRPTQKTA